MDRSLTTSPTTVTVESPIPGDGYVGFGERPGETGRWQHRNRAPGRLIQPGLWDAQAVEAFLDWAAWHRGHAADPRYQPELLLSGSREDVALHRWTAWGAEDPRWAIHVLDTTHEPVEQCARRVEAWITEQREALRDGYLPLRRGWDRGSSEHDTVPH